MVSKRVKYAGVAVGALLVLVLLGFVLGFFGTPSVDGVENRFTGVNETTTTIETNVTVDNPNPIDITFGGVDLDYAIAMNDVHMAEGDREDISLGSGTSTIGLETLLYNENIPEWWYTHVDRGEQTTVGIDVDISHGLLGGNSISIQQDEEIETDILGAFNSTDPRPVNAEQPLIEDPVLILNETTAWYGADITREETPIEMEFEFYNPKPWPYTITEVGYEIEMNEIQVGEGSTDRATVISGGATERIGAETIIANTRLDEWWVSHLERNEYTDLYVDFYVVVDPDPTGLSGVEPFRIDAPELDYETTIDTDIFGTKPDTGPPENGGDDGDGDGTESDETDDNDGTTDGDEEETDDSTNGDTSTDDGTDGSSEEDDDGVIGDDILSTGE